MFHYLSPSFCVFQYIYIHIHLYTYTSIYICIYCTYTYHMFSLLIYLSIIVSKIKLPRWLRKSLQSTQVTVAAVPQAGRASAPLQAHPLVVVTSESPVENIGKHPTDQFNYPIAIPWYHHMALGQNLVALVNIKIVCKWVFTPLTLIMIGFDTHTPTYPSYMHHISIIYLGK